MRVRKQWADDLILAACLPVALLSYVRISRYSWAWFLVVLYVTVAYRVWLTVIPPRSLRLCKNDVDRQGRLLEQILRTPAPGFLKAECRDCLARYYRSVGSHKAAEGQYAAILSTWGLDDRYLETGRSRRGQLLEGTGGPDKV